MPEVFYVPAPHDAWEWGWDAVVALGTLALAFVTVLAIVVPIFNERRKERAKSEKREQRHAIRARLYATALQDECGRTMMATAEIRKRLRAGRGPAQVDWTAVVMLIDVLAMPVLENSFRFVFLLDEHTSRWVVRTRSNILALKALIQPYRQAGQSLVACADGLLPLVLQLQRFATPAARTVHQVAQSELEIPPHVPLTAGEQALVDWIEHGGAEHARPPWPTDDPA
jgi:hypothetical protein